MQVALHSIMNAMQVDLGACATHATTLETVHESPECSELRPPFARSIVKMLESGAEAFESQGQLATSRRQI